MLLNTFAFVLALVAVGFAVAAWITSLINARSQASWRTTQATNFARSYANAERTLREANAKVAELERQSPAKLAAQVAELSDAVQRLADTQRRFAGRFHATKRTVDGLDEQADFIDPELQATLALQGAPPVSAGGKG